MALHHGTDTVPEPRGSQEWARRSDSALALPPLFKHSLVLSGLCEFPHTAMIIVPSVARARSTPSTQNSRLLSDRLYFSVWGENMATFVTSNQHLCWTTCDLLCQAMWPRREIKSSPCLYQVHSGWRDKQDELECLPLFSVPTQQNSYYTQP